MFVFRFVSVDTTVLPSEEIAVSNILEGVNGSVSEYYT